MNRFFSCFLMILTIVTLLSCSKQAQQESARKSLNILATKDFIETLGESTRRTFEEKQNCSLRFVEMENAGAIIDTLRKYKNRPGIDMVIGLGGVFLDTIRQDSVLAPFIPEHEYRVPVRHRVSKRGFLTPYQFTYVGFICDTVLVKNPPRTFGALTDHAWKDAILLPDPFKTNLGKAFYRFTATFAGPFGFPKVWRSIKPNVIMLTNTEEDSFNRFMAGEADIAMVKMTRLERLRKDGDDARYQIYMLQEGGYKYYDCAGIVKGTRNRALAQKYIEYLLSKDLQEKIPEISWMYPVNEGVELPESFDAIEVPVKEFSSKWGKKENCNESYLKRKWEKEWE